MSLLREPLVLLFILLVLLRGPFLLQGFCRFLLSSLLTVQAFGHGFCSL